MVLLLLIIGFVKVALAPLVHVSATTVENVVGLATALEVFPVAQVAAAFDTGEFR